MFRGCVIDARAGTVVPVAMATSRQRRRPVSVRRLCEYDDARLRLCTQLFEGASGDDDKDKDAALDATLAEMHELPQLAWQLVFQVALLSCAPAALCGVLVPLLTNMTLLTNDDADKNLAELAASVARAPKELHAYDLYIRATLAPMASPPSPVRPASPPLPFALVQTQQQHGSGCGFCVDAALAQFCTCLEPAALANPAMRLLGVQSAFAVVWASREPTCALKLTRVRERDAQGATFAAWLRAQFDSSHVRVRHTSGHRAECVLYALLGGAARRAGLYELMDACRLAFEISDTCALYCAPYALVAALFSCLAQAVAPSPTTTLRTRSEGSAASPQVMHARVDGEAVGDCVLGGSCRLDGSGRSMREQLATVAFGMPQLWRFEARIDAILRPSWSVIWPAALTLGASASLRASGQERIVG